MKPSISLYKRDVMPVFLSMPVEVLSGFYVLFSPYSSVIYALVDGMLLSDQLILSTLGIYI